MKGCPDRRETLWLDVYGELGVEARPQWERHLEKCTGCRQERERLLLLLERIKGAVPQPALSPETGRALQGNIMRGLIDENAATGWRVRILGRFTARIPALAAASLLVVALGWFSLRTFQGPSSVQSVSSQEAVEERLVQDLDVLENLELLKEMDVLQKLVQAVDHEEARL